MSHYILILLDFSSQYIRRVDATTAVAAGNEAVFGLMQEMKLQKRLTTSEQIDLKNCIGQGMSNFLGIVSFRIILTHR